MPHRLEQEFAAFHSAASGGTEPQRSRTLRVAERLVLSSSTAPDPADTEATADYALRRDDATLFLARYLWETSGFMNHESVGLDDIRSTETYNHESVKRIVREQMGDYYQGAKSVRIL